MFPDARPVTLDINFLKAQVIPMTKLIMTAMEWLTKAGVMGLIMTATGIRKSMMWVWTDYQTQAMKAKEMASQLLETNMILENRVNQTMNGLTWMKQIW